ncbi:LysR family transcriptional regulator [Trinickia dinghuensis]|uniref:LysR family transcriptional regulator n=1 Tax=Trinickia dinghuensis TaxID=2291023 RepID=A0A3D8JS63_9BURK|nr:LysR family transcriptional regulator [Trinickia dinghuensis]RDU95858.1 LysR family transcriptional regulator [Trinickia dinghuensis]
MKDNSFERYPEWELLVSWVAIIASGSISQAATRLGITQAGVSHRISALEAILGVTLLDRATRPARPTNAGHRLYEYATELLQNADDMLTGVRNVAHSKRSTIRLGCVDSFAATIGPIIIKALAATSNQVRLWAGSTALLQGQLEARELDFAVTTGGTVAPGVQRQQLFSEPYLAVLPKKFPTDRLTTLTALSRNLQFIRYSARSIIGQEIEYGLQMHSENIERTCESDTSDPMMSLVAAGIGFALSTPLCIWQTRQYLPDLQIVPLSAFSGDGRPYARMTRSYYLCFRESAFGNLPSSIHDLIRIGYASQVAKDVAAALGLTVEQICIQRESRR